MKQFRLASLLFCTAMVFFLISCGGDGTKEETSTDSTAADSNTTTAVVPEVNTIVTTPVRYDGSQPQGVQFCKMERRLRCT